ncbi:hypothetical protein BU26DRAFT_568807 [Trematosphaeria pertusa]|uniref:Uncharacterized protein n=1 Tax=Trematosphaeria pertusa TaxID=390896 RepID=A0A6A6I4D5_9PLEO|nr:uncharacterized protein BU26DRAFT_568807 [Trematosphaeria pertusa]KAF2244812.1 hypothetical protein BU26DRAFT_568807 [Trematosphaeria pertusa]
MSLITSWFSSCGLQDAYSLNFTCTGHGCDVLALLPNISCTTNDFGLACTNDVHCAGIPDFEDVTSWTLDGSQLIHSENITVVEEGYPVQNETGIQSNTTVSDYPDCVTATFTEVVSATVWYDDELVRPRPRDTMHTLQRRERRFNTPSSPHEDVRSLIAFVRESTQGSTDEAV